MSSNDRTVNGDWWCQMVGWSLEIGGGVKWYDGGWVWVVSYGKTESGNGCRQMIGR